MCSWTETKTGTSTLISRAEIFIHRSGFLEDTVVVRGGETQSASLALMFLLMDRAVLVRADVVPPRYFSIQNQRLLSQPQGVHRVQK